MGAVSSLSASMGMPRGSASASATEHTTLLGTAHTLARDVVPSIPAGPSSVQDTLYQSAAPVPAVGPITLVDARPPAAVCVPGAVGVRYVRRDHSPTHTWGLEFVAQAGLYTFTYFVHDAGRCCADQWAGFLVGEEKWGGGLGPDNGDFHWIETTVRDGTQWCTFTNNEKVSKNAPAISFSLPKSYLVEPLRDALNVAAARGFQRTGGAPF